MNESNYTTPHHEIRVIAHGRVRDKKHLEDIRKGALADGYIKAIVCQPISHYWEMAWPVIIFENMPDMRGNALILYLGTPESFESWKRGMMQALEQAAATRPKMPQSRPN